MGNCYGQDDPEGGVGTGPVLTQTVYKVKERFKGKEKLAKDSKLIDIRAGQEYTIVDKQNDWVKIKFVNSNQRVWVKKVNWDKLNYSPDN